MKKSYLVIASIIGIFTIGISGILYYQVYTQNCENDSVLHDGKCIRTMNGTDSDVSSSIDNVSQKECTIFGIPNGGCFVNAYKSCTPAIIQQKRDTVEGDPVFYTAIVTSTNTENQCSLELLVDATKDRFGAPGISKSICHSVKLEDNFLRFTNCEDNEERDFPMR